MSKIQSQSQYVRPRRYHREREDSDCSADDHHGPTELREGPLPNVAAHEHTPPHLTQMRMLRDRPQELVVPATGYSSWSREEGSHHPRLPPFTDQEQWTVWYNRFKDVARLHGWTEKEKLAELLPKLECSDVRI